MSANGNKARPRPRLSIVAPAASQHEAAAIAAALEQFMVETAPTPASQPQVSGWLQRAMLEGVGAEDDLIVNSR